MSMQQPPSDSDRSQPAPDREPGLLGALVRVGAILAVAVVAGLVLGLALGLSL